jgi:predicted transcriptional regulator
MQHEVRRRGRPRLHEEKCLMVSIRLEPGMRDLLRDLSKRTRQSQARVIAAALRNLEKQLDGHESAIGL